MHLTPTRRSFLKHSALAVSAAGVAKLPLGGQSSQVDAHIDIMPTEVIGSALVDWEFSHIGDPADDVSNGGEYGGGNILPASQDPLGDPADDPRA